MTNWWCRWWWWWLLLLIIEELRQLLRLFFCHLHFCHLHLCLLDYLLHLLVCFMVWQQTSFTFNVGWCGDVRAVGLFGKLLHLFITKIEGTRIKVERDIVVLVKGKRGSAILVNVTGLLLIVRGIRVVAVLSDA